MFSLLSSINHLIINNNPIFVSLLRSHINISLNMLKRLEREERNLSVIVYGKELLSEESGDNVIGKHLIIIDLWEFSSGLYICDFKSGSMNKTVKVHKH